MVMAAEIAPKKTLKIKFSTQPREQISQPGICTQQSSFVRTWGSCVPEGELSHPQTDKPPVISQGKKRGRSSTHLPSEKRQKMGRGISQQSLAVVKLLLRHPAAWVFKEPVDPVKLNIPDYFTVIKNPMDLGTIKSKLDKKQYSKAEEFASDVRLTFLNAMLYNPPSNSVHQMAEEMLEVFEARWKSFAENPKGKFLTVTTEKPVKPVRKSKNCVDSLSNFISVKDCSTCDSAPASSDLSYETPICRDSYSSDVSKMDRKVNLSKTSITKSDQDSDVTVSALDDETVCHTSQLSIAPEASLEEWRSPPSELQLSPTKALRAAMLKQRFADTILKAKHKTLHDVSDARDPVQMRIEKERLEKKQQEERALIEAKIIAANRRKEEMEVRKQREAARVTLQKMEKTAEIELNLEILRELEELSGGSLVYSPKCGEGEEERFDSPLKQFGLFIKDDSDEEDEVVSTDGEEGEILF